MEIEKLKPLFPMGYLILSVLAAVIFRYVGVPDTVGGIIIGAAITRVKLPPNTPQSENPEKQEPTKLNIQ